MLSNKQKIEYFKRNMEENYRASLALEGITLKKNLADKSLAELKAKYAR